MAPTEPSTRRSASPPQPGVERAWSEDERRVVALSRVRPEPDVAALTAGLAAADLDRLVALGTRVGNHDLVARRLLAAAGDRMGAAVRARCQRRLEWARLRGRAAFDDLRALARHLEPAGVPVVLLKGGAYDRWIYPAPGLRRFADLDLLLEPEALPQAQAFLQRLGYRVSSAIAGSVDLRRALGDRLGVAIELTTEPIHHHDYPYYQDAFPLAASRLIAASEPRDLDGVPVRVLGAGDELAYSVLHHFLHHDLVGLRYHSDVNALLTDPVRRLAPEAAIAAARAARAEHAVGLALLVQRALFGPDAVPEALHRALVPGGLRRAGLLAMLPELARLPFAGERVAGHPVKALSGRGVRVPLHLGLRWLLPGSRYLATLYGRAGGRALPADHLRYAAAVLAKAWRRGSASG